MNALICLMIVALASSVCAEDAKDVKKQEKRGVFGLGYGGYHSGLALDGLTHGYLGAPAISVGHSIAAAPLPVSHGYTAPISVSHGYTAPISVSHGYTAPLPVSHGYTAPLQVSHGYTAPLPVSHGYTASLPVSHGYNAPILSAAPVRVGYNSLNLGHGIGYSGLGLGNGLSYGHSF